MQKITPFLWFNDNAEEAVHFYTSIFTNSAIDNITYYGAAGPRPEGSVMTVSFRLEGQPFIALNGGPHYQLTPAISLYVNCETQAEVDEYWDKLSAGGGTQQCGWCTDRYGLSWQVIPVQLMRLMQDADAAKSNRVMAAMLKMTKIDIAQLEQAYHQQ